MPSFGSSVGSKLGILRGSNSDRTPLSGLGAEAPELGKSNLPVQTLMRLEILDIANNGLFSPPKILAPNPPPNHSLVCGVRLTSSGLACTHGIWSGFHWIKGQQMRSKCSLSRPRSMRSSPTKKPRTVSATSATG